MNNFCKKLVDTGISYSDIGKLTDFSSKAIISANDNNVTIEDVITEDNMIAIANNIKNGSTPKSEMIRLINKANIDDKTKVIIIADMFS